MSRERKTYTPLDVEDTEAKSGRPRARRGRRNSFSWLEEQSYCSTAAAYLPSFLTSCLESGARGAYDDLLEQFEDLESRHSVLLETVKSEREERSLETSAATSEIAALRRDLLGADEAENALQKDLAEVQERLHSSEHEVAELGSSIAAAETTIAAANAALASFREQASQLATEMSAEKLGHAAVQKELSNATSGLAKAVQDLDASRLAAVAADEQLESMQAQVSRLTEELRMHSAAAQEAVEQHLDKEAKIRSCLADAQQESLRLAAEVAELQATVTVEQQKSEGLSAELAAQTSRAQQSTDALLSSKARCSQQEAELSAQQESAAKLSEQLGSARKEAEDLRLSLAAAERNLADSEEQMRAFVADGQVAKAELSAARRERSMSEQMLRVAQEETAALHEALEAANEEGLRLSSLLQQADAHIASLQAGEKHDLSENATMQGYRQASTSSRDAASEDSRPETDFYKKAAPAGQDVRNAMWDSAAEIRRPSEADIPTSRGSGLPESFRGRPGWQELWEEGAAAGWLASADAVERKDVIGKGSFGTTYLGALQGREAAIKCVRVDEESSCRAFLREVGSLVRVQHPNVMRLISAVIQPPQVCWLVMEYLPGGTLAEWLHGRTGRSASRRTINEKLAMALGIARGMLALQSSVPPVMHRDLKPANVLLDSDGTPKLADFGLCREHLEDEAYTYTGETGSYTYMSPEMMRGDIYGPPTDVYSFAILVTEILKQAPPFEEFYLTPMQVAEGVAYHDLRPRLPGGLPGGLKPLLEACWEAEPEGRPGFDLIVPHLADIAGNTPQQRRGFFS